MIDLLYRYIPIFLLEWYRVGRFFILIVAFDHCIGIVIFKIINKTFTLPENNISLRNDHPDENVTVEICMLVIISLQVLNSSLFGLISDTLRGCWPPHVCVMHPQVHQTS